MTRQSSVYLAAVCLQILFVSNGWAQPAPAADPAVAGNNLQQTPPAPPEWRNTTTYPFTSIAHTIERMQFLAFAQQLREYCANQAIPDNFVHERLKRFSAMTGREESCKSLLDY